MQDPSFGVLQPLAGHVHLVSAHKYPYTPQLPLERAFQWLIEAPKIVGQLAPMSWQYLNGPQDGTVFLTYMGAQSNGQAASDGYLWAGQEEHMMQDWAGYNIEIAVHATGFRISGEQVACHSRRRYRIVSKNPNVNAGFPDPRLWLVHYSQAEPHKTVPASQIQITPPQHRQIQERRWIESQGRLERQDFMLHDREHWPHLRLSPNRGQSQQAYGQNPYAAQNPMAHASNSRFSGQYYQQGPQAMAGPSPAKRQRPNPPATMPPVPPAAAVMPQQDNSIEIEEDITVGDYLDGLTQRDLSFTRYMQHHEWMEEVFSSPYATGHIVPADLGFGLAGELAGLTDGIFDAIVKEQEKVKAGDATGVDAYKSLQPDQIKEFETRVSQHLEDGQAELQRMKDEHKKKMQELRRSKTLLRAERRLRNAAWDENDKSLGEANGQANGHAPERVDAVVEDVEKLFGASVRPQSEVKMVERGGLREKVTSPALADNGIIDGAMDLSHSDSTQRRLTANDTSVTVAELKAGFQAPQQPSAPADVPQTSLPQVQPPPPQQAEPQPEREPSIPSAAADVSNMDDTDNMDTLDESNFEMGGMDLDIGEASNFDFDTGAAHSEEAPVNQVFQQPLQPSQTHVGASSTAQDPGAVNTAPSQQGNPASAQSQMFGGTGGAGAGADNFDDFTADDGLIDFEGGDGEEELGLDLGMDNSAFGDAFQDTEGADGGIQ